jgi:hypothetical protein
MEYFLYAYKLLSENIWLSFNLKLIDELAYLGTYLWPILVLVSSLSV